MRGVNKKKRIFEIILRMVYNKIGLSVQVKENQRNIYVAPLKKGLSDSIATQNEKTNVPSQFIIRETEVS